jgi:hypothetical protein
MELSASLNKLLIEKEYLEYSLYQQIFTFAAHINEAAPNSFKYIVTTTEAPPKALIASHVKLNLNGSTGAGRLYRQNL